MKDRKPLFIFGMNRSGTNMLAWSLEKALGTVLFNEDHPEAFENFELRDHDTIAGLIRQHHDATCIFKSILNMYEADSVVEEFDGRGIVIFRPVGQVASSLLNEFGETGINDVRRQLADIAAGRLPILTRRPDSFEGSIRPLVADYLHQSLDEASAIALSWLCLYRIVFAAHLHRDPRFLVVGYDRLTRDPAAELQRICAFAGLELRPEMAEGIKPSTRLVPREDIDQSLRVRCDAMYAALSRLAIRPPPEPPAAAALPAAAVPAASVPAIVPREDSPAQLRSLAFKGRSHNRYWWFNHIGLDYVPPIFSLLTDEEWGIMNDWYQDSERNFVGTGECAVPAMAMLMGFIMGNNIGRIVQLGHYIGFSTLILGFIVRKMGRRRCLFSIDIDRTSSAYTQSWLDKAGLGEQVQLCLSDSAAPETVERARAYLGGDPQLVFIDSSHQYQHTMVELDLWYGQLAAGGVIMMHDVSPFASQYDSTKAGGVGRALQEWQAKHSVATFALNAFCDGSQRATDLVYRDACGLGLIQKPAA